MSNNPILFNAALAGAIGGLNSERWITSTEAADYITVRNSAVAFATAVDLAIAADTTITQQHGELLESICASVLTARGLAGTSTAVAASIAILFGVARLQLESVPTGATGTAPGFISQLSTTAGDFPVGTTVISTAAQIPQGGRFRVICIASGSSGGSGLVATAVLARVGASGAGGCARAERWFSRQQLIDALPISVVVPAGTAVVPGVVSLVSAIGTSGTQGGVCSFGSLLSAYPGAAGVGTTAQVSAGGGGDISAAVANVGGRPSAGVDAVGDPIIFGGIAGGGATGHGTSGTPTNGLPSEDGGAAGGVSSTTLTAFSGGNSIRGGAGAGAGGGHTNGGLGLDGGRGGATGPRIDGVTSGSGALGGVGGLGANGADGADATVIGQVGQPGGGGSGNGTTGGTGGKGGNGGIPGGAGAGGGCAETDGVSAGTSGAGGSGARGECVLEAYT